MKFVYLRYFSEINILALLLRTILIVDYMINHVFLCVLTVKRQEEKFGRRSLDSFSI